MRWQEHLGNTIRSIFPDKNVLTNVRKNAHIVHASSGRFLELDFWIPDLKLAFEYQDPHHYVSTWYSNVSAQNVQHRDDLKKVALDNRGETLISVPCWWDGTEDSLIATVSLTRPELFSNWSKRNEPISTVPPSGFFKENEVRGVGQLMLASFAHSASEDFNFKSWWLSEKYDGIRACWNSDDSVLYSRFGRPIMMPMILAMLFPELYLDAEIWFGRGSFHQSLNFYDEPTLQEIDMLKIVAFDAPNLSVQDLPFEKRYALLVASIAPDHPFLINVPCHACWDTKHAKRIAKILLESGSEGSVVRAPKSAYQQGRSENLIKFKAHRDQEALVLHLNSDGTYTVRLSDSSECIAPLTPDWDVANTPTIGDVITLVYAGYLPYGSLKHPRICNLRPDLTWNDVLAGSSYSQSATLVSRRALAQVNERQQQGYWTADESRNVRRFFDNYAKGRNFDPLVAANWYTVSRSDFMNEGGHKVLIPFNGSLITGLVDTYPELYFEEHKFTYLKKSYWSDKAKRREFLIKFAKSRNFDPLNPDNWHSISQKTLVQSGSKVSSLLSFYNNSYTAALMDLFPEIGIDPTKFTKIKQGYWDNEQNRRTFFDNYAAKRNLDPLNPETWYPIEQRHLVEEKGWHQILEHYNRSVQEAVLALYPEIGLNPMKFHSRAIRGYWHAENNVRKFFDTLAQKLCFDPLVAQNWYDNVNQDSIKGEKGGFPILAKYSTYAAAISAAYPDLTIEPHKFAAKPVEPTESEKREFFVNFASRHGFDPSIAKNWYRFSSSHIVKEKGGRRMLLHYDNSLVLALQQLFPDIGIDPYLFLSCRKQRAYWSDKENVKLFFDGLARKRGFDPSENVEPWYQVKRFDVRKEKGGAAIVSNFQGSYVAALKSVYPSLEPKKFKFAHVTHYQTVAERKVFFDRLATTKGFDPSVAANWAVVSHRELVGKKGGSTILSNFNGSLLAALQGTYPNFM